MARSINDIKKTMTDAFMADADIREKYGLAADATFDDSFSSVSLENILFYIIAACCHVLEVFFDTHKADVDTKISRAVVASVPWYHKMALQFQYGDVLVFDEATQQYVYATSNLEKQKVKYVAVRDRGTSIQILVSGEKDERPAVLSDDVLTAFKSYMNRIKIAGVILAIRSLPADLITVSATVHIDPLVIDKQGTRISDGSKPVEEAVENYLKGILYGGTFNKTKLVDAIQSVEGVADVELLSCSYSTDEGRNYKTISGNNYTAVGGSFVASGLSNTLSYVVQN
ncbi:MAG: hypothetical protein IKY71_07890 [Bacteroidaceae bacterium]|nr:hypothetical protein [Bacteroidaceae bacterium]